MSRKNLKNKSSAHKNIRLRSCLVDKALLVKKRYILASSSTSSMIGASFEIGSIGVVALFLSMIFIFYSDICSVNCIVWQSKTSYGIGISKKYKFSGSPLGDLFLENHFPLYTVVYFRIVTLRVL